MGVVVAAHDTELDRPVAIKFSRGAQRDRESNERLIREARSLAKLAHPNVITIHDSGVVDGELFIVMELVEGGTLRDWLEATRPWREIVEMFIAAGRGLVAAHEAGLVHRDFKPANVLVGADQRPRVSDFGLGGLEGRPSQAGSPSMAAGAGLTQNGAVLGTPAYMAPEQRAGRPIDARADQFAFCVSLYDALLTGDGVIGRVPTRRRIPFVGTGPTDVPVVSRSPVPRLYGAPTKTIR